MSNAGNPGSASGSGNAPDSELPQPGTPLPPPPQPVTLPPLAGHVDPDRTIAGGRAFLWPEQHGQLAPANPGGIPSGELGHVLPPVGRFTIPEMQRAQWAVMKLMVMTDRHLEAAMGRSRGSALCLYPDNIPEAIKRMTEAYEVPYGLHEIGHACFLIWTIGSHMYGKPWVCTSLCSRQWLNTSLP